MDDPQPDDDDAIAMVLLADALGAQPDPVQPGMGDPTTPDMGARMSTDPAAPAAPATPAAPAAPAPAAPPTPAPAAAPGPPAPGADEPGASGEDGDRGFPANTPVAQMRPEQQAAYYKHQARKHEQAYKDLGDVAALRQKAADYEKLVAASKTAQEKAVEAAKNEGRAAAMAEVGGRLVEAEMKVAIGGRMDADAFAALVDGVNLSRFLDATGNVDTAKVTSFVNHLLPASTQASAPASPPAPGNPAAAAGTPPRGPDFGQGVHAGAPPSPLEAGRAAARARHAPAQPLTAPVGAADAAR